MKYFCGTWRTSNATGEQRKAAVRVASAYSIVLLEVIQVTTGTIPIHIPVEERNNLTNMPKEVRKWPKRTTGKGRSPGGRENDWKITKRLDKQEP